jgi:hypothetical protein
MAQQEWLGCGKPHHYKALQSSRQQPLGCLKGTFYYTGNPKNVPAPNRQKFLLTNASSMEQSQVNMTLSTDSTASPASSSSFLPTNWSEHVLRKKYTDPMKLKESLDEIYGQGKYQVIVCSGYLEVIHLESP